MKDPPLQPLRVPANWTIGYNTFAELDPADDVMAYFCEDLFQATCAMTNVLVDLGFYPDGDVNGGYVVVAYVGDFRGRQLLRVEAKTRAEATAALEAALWKYHCVPPRA